MAHARTLPSRFDRTLIKTARARALRRPLTEAETRLWCVLRRGTLGESFRKQHPVGPYILDFYCARLKLAIELDGSQHRRQEAYDARRTSFLNASGIEVLRFWNIDVVRNMDGVGRVILDAISAMRLTHAQQNSSP